MTSLWCGSQQRTKKLTVRPHHNAFWVGGKNYLPGILGKLNFLDALPRKAIVEQAPRVLQTRFRNRIQAAAVCSSPLRVPPSLPPSLSCKAGDVAIANGGLPSLGPRAGPPGQRERTVAPLIEAENKTTPDTHQHTPPHSHTILPSFVGKLSLGL